MCYLFIELNIIFTPCVMDDSLASWCCCVVRTPVQCRLRVAAESTGMEVFLWQQADCANKRFCFMMLCVYNAGSVSAKANSRQ